MAVIENRRGSDSAAMKKYFIFVVLLKAKLFAHLFYRFSSRWVGEVPEDRWDGIRLLVLLNHTSLFEWLYIGLAPWKLVWQIAAHGVIPVAEKTLKRPFVGRFFAILAQHVVSITRKPDESWRQLLASVNDPKATVLILPEGRMMRATGLDAEGKPMTVRGGVADIMRAMDRGRVLFGYMAGLHHVQVPGQRFPGLFKRLEMTLEVAGLEDYKRSIGPHLDAKEFKRRVKQDLEERKARWCESFVGRRS